MKQSNINLNQPSRRVSPTKLKVQERKDFHSHQGVHTEGVEGEAEVVVEEVEVEAILEKVLGKPKKRGAVLLVLAANAEEEEEDEAPDEEKIEVVNKGCLNNNQPNEVHPEGLEHKTLLLRMPSRLD